MNMRVKLIGGPKPFDGSMYSLATENGLAPLFFRIGIVQHIAPFLTIGVYTYSDFDGVPVYAFSTERDNYC